MYHVRGHDDDGSKEDDEKERAGERKKNRGDYRSTRSLYTEIVPRGGFVAKIERYRERRMALTTVVVVVVVRFFLRDLGAPSGLTGCRIRNIESSLSESSALRGEGERGRERGGTFGY